MSVLAIDIGNSRVGFNVFTDGRAGDPAVRLTHDQLVSRLDATLDNLWDLARRQASDSDPQTPRLVIASVVPELTRRIDQTARRRLGISALVVGHDLKVPLKTHLTDESTVGQDRLLGALAAFVNVQAACAIIHAGTALVVDAIDDDAVFRGGAIAPGLAMAARALHRSAAQLPQASLTPLGHDLAFGRTTQEALNLGIFAAARGAVRELIERYAAALGHWPHVVATGGDAQVLLAPDGPDGSLVDSFIPDLVLQGAALACEHHHIKSS